MDSKIKNKNKKTYLSSLRRSEIKYDISNFSEQFIINKFNLKELYPKREITSIYFDTNDFEYFHLSQEGILPRKKIRIRFYNKGSYNLEIKFQDFSSKIKKVIKSININNINEYFLRYGIKEIIKPKIIINFSRRYFSSYAGRVTIDKDLNYSFCKQNFFFEGIGKISSNQKILEIKNDNINNKVFYSFSDIELKEQRNSKYCNGIDYLYNNKFI